jgi:copper oxidase (laccase) domain-containing protein
MMLMSLPQPTDGFAWVQEPWGSALRCGTLPVPHLFTSRDLVLRDDDQEWATVAASRGVDSTRQVIGAVHAGWRGTAAGAAGAAIRSMRATYGCNPSAIVAAIGPCLGACCGEMGPEVVQLFRAAGHEEADINRWFTTGKTSRPYLDLERANREQLVSAGVPAENIRTSGLCTKTHHDRLHSYRADGARAGRLLAAIRLPSPAR